MAKFDKDREGGQERRMMIIPVKIQAQRLRIAMVATQGPSPE